MRLKYEVIATLNLVLVAECKMTGWTVTHATTSVWMWAGVCAVLVAWVTGGATPWKGEFQGEERGAQVVGVLGYHHSALGMGLL